MPLYAYACACGHSAEEWHPMKDRNSKGPKHCGKRMPIEITGSHSVWKGFEPYQAMGREKAFIRTRAEHKAYLARNNYEEVGNDNSMAPPELYMHKDDFKQYTRELEREQRQDCEVLERHDVG